MKKLIVTAVLASSFLLFGCGDPNQETIDKVTKHIESRQDMFPYKLEFKDLNYIAEKDGKATLCGEIRLSHKSNIKADKLPKIFFSNMSEDIEQVIGSNEHFKFEYTIEPDFERSNEIKPIMLIHPYDQQELEFWRLDCKR
ncbi:major membrane immunogen (membrane-anchored lipoprotein) [Providencia alcalifaciens]|nr:major membrane immunogen (membrane-anchored lipoprotein) [Providencia alcalifaciens]